MTFSEDDFPRFGDWSRPGDARGALVYVIDGEGRALMQLRDDRPGVIHAGYWSPFGGGVEAGETLVQAALGEIEEETGLRLAPEALRPFGRVVSDAPRRTRLHAFVARQVFGPEEVRLGEGAGFALLSAEQLRDARVSPPLRAMTLALAKRLEG